MFVSIHIPKTAGTTLGWLFDNISAKKVLWDYRGDTFNPEGDGYGQGIGCNEKFAASMKANKDFLSRHFIFIHGHFRYEQYANVFPEGRFITCLREPISRIISNYRHLLRERPGDNISLTDFANLPQFRNLQSTLLKGRALQDYDHIFLTERLQESLAIFACKFPELKIQPDLKKTIPVQNSDKQQHKQRISIWWAKRKLRKSQAEDIALYAKAIERHEQEVLHYL
jgi:hypothetical protein